eukprot:Blabericola_migrator_1__11810@NODE_717_length_6744_cov_38_850831_g517_i0_p5_GENE_NODE_717_length_6744_cov_38_850831_g517_i0NODE_717_length_6744_cov_38_850831_g517_i0_p5_ORF_typecomplete_len164_score38_96_NODE_717_length_6744_cov_38_850831_g517_i047915282
MDFVKTSIYQQKLNPEELGEEEVEVANVDKAPVRPEFRLLNDREYTSLHDQLKDNAALRDKLMGPSSPLMADNDADEGEESLYYGSELVDCPESRLEEKQEVEAFQRERVKMFQKEEVVLPSEPDQKEADNRETTKRRRGFFDNSVTQKKSKVNILEGYNDSD